MTPDASATYWVAIDGPHVWVADHPGESGDQVSPTAAAARRFGCPVSKGRGVRIGSDVGPSAGHWGTPVDTFLNPGSPHLSPLS